MIYIIHSIKDIINEDIYKAMLNYLTIYARVKMYKFLSSNEVSS